MEIGIVGLGRMGAGIAERLRRHGHQVIGYDRDAALTEVDALETLSARLTPPRVVWIMLPAGDPTQSTMDAIAARGTAGDILVDGGNSDYRDTVRRAAALTAQGLHLLDVGTSGGIRGLADGYCLMVGGAPQAVAVVEPMLAAVAAPGGYAHLGPSGAGHYAKMIHNAIEYGMLQAYAEGFQLLRAADFDFDLPQTAALWRHGSVIRSWLLDLAAEAFHRDPGLETLGPAVDDSGEARWAVREAVDRGIPAGMTAQALFTRFASRDEDAFGLRVIAALRREFGGHPVQEP